MSDEVYKARQEDGKTFYCPNGCKRYFTDTKVSKLKKRVDELAESRRYWKVRADNESRRADHEERRRVGFQGYAAKLKKQLAAATTFGDQ